MSAKRTNKKDKKQKKPAFDILKNRLVPEAKILNAEEREKLLEDYNISFIQLPRILYSDAVVKVLEANAGDIIEFKRKTKTAGLSKYYRVVVKGGK